MGNREFINKQMMLSEYEDILDCEINHSKYENTVREIIEEANETTAQAIAKPLFIEFKEKLSKWMYHNSESVCGDSMIDIDYLEGHIDEILYEMGIIGEVEE